MATGYLAVFAGQSWLDAVFSEASRPDVPASANVKMMRAATRVWHPFDSAGKWNLYVNGATTGNSPVFKFADEWEARANAGLLTGNLYILSVAKGGSGFDSRYSVPNFTQWRADRNSYNGSGVQNGSFSIPADIGGGVYSGGDSYSAYETLRQGLQAAVSGIQAAGDTPRLLFTYWSQGLAEATVSGLTQAEYYGYEMSIKNLVDAELGVATPWISPLIAGDAIVDRPATAAVNAAKVQIASEGPRRWAPDPQDFPEYDPQNTPTYGGIFGSDGTHLSNFGCWRLADVCFNLTLDSGFNGVAL